MALKITGITVVDDSQEATFDGMVVTEGNYLTVKSPLTRSQAQGITSGFTSGGTLRESVWYNTIDTFPFATDSNASDWADLSISVAQSAGQSSTVSGYNSAGRSPAPGAFDTRRIEKFSFSSRSNSVLVGNVTQLRRGVAGQSSETDGFSSGGWAPGYTNVIDKFPFATDTNATDHGDLSVARSSVAGQSSTTHGYSTGGWPSFNQIDKFAFATTGNATDVGDLTQGRGDGTGMSSLTHGYTAGGGITNIIDKFSFSADGNATDVADLTVAKETAAGISSDSFGYASGGRTGSPGSLNVIEKFPFASDSNATDVGDLTQARDSASGQQV
jgi:hypothetical protein